MGTKADKVEHLRNLPLFSACTKRELQQIAKAGDEITVEEGKLLIDQGTLGREAFVILDGRITVTRGSTAIATLSTGDIVGELALLDHGPRTASAICDTECTLFVLDQRHFRVVIDKTPSIARKMLAVLAGRIRTLDRQSYG